MSLNVIEGTCHESDHMQYVDEQEISVVVGRQLEFSKGKG